MTSSRGGRAREYPRPAPGFDGPAAEPVVTPRGRPVRRPSADARTAVCGLRAARPVADRYRSASGRVRRTNLRTRARPGPTRSVVCCNAARLATLAATRAAAFVSRRPRRALPEDRGRGIELWGRRGLRMERCGGEGSESARSSHLPHLPECSPTAPGTRLRSAAGPTAASPAHAAPRRSLTSRSPTRGRPGPARASIAGQGDVEADSVRPSQLVTRSTPRSRSTRCSPAPSTTRRAGRPGAGETTGLSPGAGRPLLPGSSRRSFPPSGPRRGRTAPAPAAQITTVFPYQSVHGRPARSRSNVVNSAWSRTGPAPARSRSIRASVRQTTRMKPSIAPEL